MNVPPLPSRFLTQTNFWHRIQAPRFSGWMIPILLLVSGNFFIFGQFRAAVLLVTLTALVFPIGWLHFYMFLDRVYRQAQWDRYLPLQSLGWMLFGTGLVCVQVMQLEPAHAQFFFTAETWLKTKFTGTGSTNLAPVISLVFNVLRFLLLIYVAIALIGIARAGQQQDRDWQDLARTPAILVGVLFIGEQLSNFITGTGTGV